MYVPDDIPFGMRTKIIRKESITSDIIEDFDKRKMQEMANKHLAEV